MLMQSTPESITLLPALPEEWHSGSVKGLCARGGFTLDFAWHKGTVKTLTLHSAKGGKASITLNGTTIEVLMSPGETRTVTP